MEQDMDCNQTVPPSGKFPAVLAANPALEPKLFPRRIADPTAHYRFSHLFDDLPGQAAHPESRSRSRRLTAMVGLNCSSGDQRVCLVRLSIRY